MMESVLSQELTPTLLTKPLIKLAYRQVIDSSCQSDFERKVFEDTYLELLLQAQVYNREKRFKTVAEIISANSKANSLHYKIGFAVGLYVNELNKKIPGLTDLLGNDVAFEIFKTDIVHSDLTDKSAHAVALTFITKPLKLLANFGSYLLLSGSEEESDDGVKTFMLQMQPFLSIISYKENCNQLV